MNISLAPEPVFLLGKLVITNSILTAWLITALLLILATLMRRSLSKVPGRGQALMETIYAFFLDLIEKIIGRSDVSRELFPFVITLFLFIVLSNWSGLLPGFGTIGLREIHNGKEVLIPLFRAPTSDLNMVGAMAVLAMGYVQYLGIKYAGPKAYFKKFFNFQNPIGFFIGLVELISEFTRVISFSFRLFGNIFAGEVLLAVMFFLTITMLPYAAVMPLPFFFLEMFVGIIQAFIFCFLTIVFTSLSVVAHDSAGHPRGGEELQVPERAAEAEQLLENEWTGLPS